MSPVQREISSTPATDNRHPLNYFRGVLVDIDEETRTPNRVGAKPYIVLIFKFDKLEVIESNEPYKFPTTVIEMPEFNFQGTAWNALKQSLVPFESVIQGNINNLIGKSQEWAQLPATMRDRQQDGTNPDGTQKYTYGDVVRNTWHVVAVEGAIDTQAQLMEAIVNMADGKDETSFSTSLLGAVNLRNLSGYVDMVQQVVQRKLLGNLVTAGQLSFDGILYHKV